MSTLAHNFNKVADRLAPRVVDDQNCPPPFSIRFTFEKRARLDDERGRKTLAAHMDMRDGMKALAHKRRRFGYRRLHVLLRREGHAVNCYPAVHVYMHERAQACQRQSKSEPKGSAKCCHFGVGMSAA